MATACIPWTDSTAAASAHMTIIVVAGQSNATGFESYVTSPTDRTNVLAATATRADSAVKIAWVQPNMTNVSAGLGPSGPVPLDTAQREAPNPLVPSGADVFGPEVALARGLDVRGDTNIVVVKVSQSGTALASPASVWTPQHGAMYNQIVAAVRDVEAYERGRDVSTSVGGVFWVQGESDATNPVWASAYRSRIAAFILALRTDLGAPTAPFVIAKESIAAAINFERYIGACSPAACIALAHQDAEVRAADDWVTEHLAHIGEVDTASLPRGGIGIHLTDTAELALGEDLAAVGWAVGAR